MTIEEESDRAAEVGMALITLALGELSEGIDGRVMVAALELSTDQAQRSAAFLAALNAALLSDMWGSTEEAVAAHRDGAFALLQEWANEDE